MDVIKATLSAKLAQLQVALQPTLSQAIYTTAAAVLGTHITLDASVPPDLGCAEAVSYILTKAGIPNIPPEGFPGTAGLYTWLQANFILTTTPQAGDVVISPTGTSTTGSPHGHTGIVAKYGILSNDSDTGLFLEKYTQASWETYFHGTEGFPVFYYRFYYNYAKT